MKLKTDGVWLKWAVLPLLAFLLGGWVTQKISRATRAPEEPPFQQAVNDSMKKLGDGDEAGAVAGLARAGEMASGDPTRQTGLIPKFLALGEYKLAADAMERALRSGTKERQTAGAFSALGEFLLEHGDAARAKQILTGDLTRRWPDAVETAYLKGAVALAEAKGREDFAAVASQLQKCVAMDAEHGPAKLKLGMTYEKLGQWTDAESVLRAALKKRPSDPVVLGHLAEVLRQQGKTEDASKCLVEGQRLQALVERRKYLEAQYALNKHQPVELLELSRVYAQLGQPARAESTLRVYARLKPEDADAQRELVELRAKISGQKGAGTATESARSELTSAPDGAQP